ncbi:hypothetical protein WEI85_11430 [Actinomycetes bacterium KLBMP 9797]
MKIFKRIERPSVLPVALAPVSAVCAMPLARADVSQLQRANQVQTVNPAQTWTLTEGSYGISGSTAKGAHAAVDVKQRLDVRGVPPRGRPV